MTAGLPIPGYVEQNQSNIDIVKNNKYQEELVLRILDMLATMPNVDKRWLAIGRTQMEQAWMAINRSIFNPSRVKLPEDKE